MRNRNHGLSEKEMELVKYLMADCQSTGDIQNKLKRLFAGTIEQMLEVFLYHQICQILILLFHQLILISFVEFECKKAYILIKIL